jgi:cyclohexanone monooxygenase
VVVIGSGATAVTLVPALAETAAKVTMLQRSPTYLVSLPARDALAQRLRRWLPPMLAYRLVRTKNIGLGMLFFRFARRWPARARQRLLGLVRAQLPPGADLMRDFTPRYDPWDQRVCVVPDGDLFKAIRAGRAEVLTDHIERFTPQGIRLVSGRELPADLVITATGLALNVMGDVAVSVDGRAVDFSRTLAYKGMMFSGVPNLVYTFGYTNASWTLKADLSADWLCRLLVHLQRRGLAVATPQPDAAVQPRPFLDFSSGYVQRALDRLPRQGDRRPWRLYQNYLLDLLLLRFGRLGDGTLRLAPAGSPLPPAETPLPTD